MPLYYLSCPSCGDKVTTICTPAQLKGRKCLCGSILKREQKGPTTAVKEVIDNGVMVRQVERFSDAEELFDSLGEADKKIRRGD